MQSIPGIIDAQSSYANGTCETAANYQSVCSGLTGFRETVERLAGLECGRYDSFLVELGLLKDFFPAEEYHQNYLEKNPAGYYHIPWKEIRLFSRLQIDPGRYQRPEEAAIRDKLTEEQFHVTQERGMEAPFQNEHWDRSEREIYVDVVTGKPLFSSADKFDSACRWPGSTRPIEEPVLFNRTDRSHGMVRTEVQNRTGNSHLGHVF